jgi:segregation and condensation protein B
LTIDKYFGLIQAILLYENDIVSVEKLKNDTGLEEEKIRLIIGELQKEFEKEIHGITVAEVAGGFIIQAKKEIYQDIKQIYGIKEKAKLSQSALTVLSIIAYKQPITKLEIDEIRGVSSDNAIKILLEKNLIEITGRKEALGRPLLYGTTNEFLKCFNLKSIDDLPQLNELKSDEFSIEEE